MSTPTPGPDAGAPAPKKPSNVVSLALTGIGFLLALISGFISWFAISGSNFTLLPDAYQAMWVYITQGSSGLQTLNALGEFLVKGSTAHPLVIIGFALVLFFWPATLASSAYNLAAREFAPYPFIWAVIAFISAYLMIYYGGASLDDGAYLIIVAGILFLVAAFTQRKPKPAPAATPAASAAAPAAPAPGSSTPTQN